jgi:hypothetical protein
METELATDGFTEMTIELLVALAEVTQFNEDVNWQLTTSPLFKDDDVNVGLFSPTFKPLTFH